MINWILDWLIPKTPKEKYTYKLAKYIKQYGEPMGSRTSDWVQPEANKLLGSRLDLYKYYTSKSEAIKAANILIQTKRV